MHSGTRAWAIALIGLGAGLVTGGSLAQIAIWPGIALMVLGIIMLTVGRGPREDSTDNRARPPAGDGRQPANVGRTEGRTDGRTDGRTENVSGLGPRVEAILRLAQEQADRTRADAVREATELLADARSEAHAIVARARAGNPPPTG